MEPGTFQGEIGRYHWESTPWWPPEQRPADDAPNVMLVVLDDVGFAQLGCYGSDIETPALDGLAAQGLQYTNFHTTALCSPTRACLLTGRNHHSNGMGRIIDLATGFPGYDATIPAANGFLPEMLVPEGYAAWAVGKWHLTPEEECHLAASAQALATRSGIRALVRLLRRGSTPVRPRVVARQPPDHAAGHLRGRLPPHRRSR